jgi:GNAT superfamily N-acetyltransferase
VPDLFAQVLAFDRGIRTRGAQRVTPIPNGVVVHHDELPRLHHLNAVLLDTAADASAVTELADQHLAGLQHRTVVIDDIDAAERAWPELQAAGWTRQRVDFMQLLNQPDHPPRPGLTREIGDAEAHAVQLELLGEEAPAESGGLAGRALAELLTAGQEAVRAGTRSRCFAAGEDGRLDSMCTLFLGDGFAMIEEVGTRVCKRGRGLARAVVSAAIEAAQAEHCDPIMVPADADDWPQLLYVKLGFEPLGRQISFTRTNV